MRQQNYSLQTHIKMANVFMKIRLFILPLQKAGNPILEDSTMYSTIYFHF